MTENDFRYTPFQMVDILQDISVINNMNYRADYGLGESFTPVEVHTVSKIAHSPGITVSEIADYWCKTRGAVSQIIKRLETRGLIYRRRHPSDNKYVQLFVTERGVLLDEMHKKFDEREFDRILQPLLKCHDVQTINSTFDVLFDLIKVYQNTRNV